VTRIVAVNAAANGNFAITIGASEVLAQTDFVYAAVKSIAYRTVIRVETFTVPSAFQCDGKVHGSSSSRVNKIPANTQATLFSALALC
jgi:hypothetical protein